MKRRKTKAQIQAQLQRALNSLRERSAKYPNLPRSAYNLSQQEGYVRQQMAKGVTNMFNGRNGNRQINAMINHGDRQENKREEQLRTAAQNLMAKASGGRG